jgi:adenosylcobinamide kinase/adenosylcobinamide-phosphate guanylyltransferase
VRTLVLGGIRSGKSRWAELALARETQARETQVRYIATGPAADSGAGWAQRIAAHRQRRPSDWTTVESADVATQLRTRPDSPALVDDLGGWLTATLDRRGWEDEPITEDVDQLVAAVGSFGAPLVLVSPEVGLTVIPATAAGRRFADELGVVNQRIAECCERVVLVIAGQPLWVKPPLTASN